MNARILLLAAALITSSFGCAQQTDEDQEGSADAVTRLDSIGAPTDTNVTLAMGRWHDNVLTPKEGWHSYHFTATETGYVRIVMKAEIGHPNMWSYLRIEHKDPTGEKPWLHNTAGVGNTRTNLCEIIMKLEAGAKYDIITTSQFNLTNLTPGRHKSDGKYTVGIMPIDSTIRIPE